jgi:nucleoid DNA-binding protein
MKKVIKKDLALSASIASSISSKESGLIIKSFISLLSQRSKTNIVKLHNFGTFKYKHTPKRMGRNPKTNQSFEIKAFKKLTFASSLQIKKIIN